MYSICKVYGLLAQSNKVNDNNYFVLCKAIIKAR